ncbi:11951_t:CDS:2 [Diversispora eburnea]|uniref:11951_t:CDS:1 n=1 Tax=Diversispora eburnea TaxID=1213867 RepID=A0A9N9GCN2_9GLOM|nr:11951_t:CDS:2 [Diversispora eburnea]
MDPLVESLLKSSIDDEGDPTRSPDASDLSDAEEFTQPVRSDVPTHGGRQTGPKGVLADHAYHKRQMQQQKAKSITTYNEHMLSKALTTTTFREDEIIKAQEEELFKDLENIRNKKKRFGTLREISSNQYVKAIDNELPNVSVIVHLYENSNPQCRLLNECLTQLAKKFVYAKFIRILAHDLEFDPIGLPALLVYKNGDLIANLVKITDEIGENNFDFKIVENVLIRYGVLNQHEDIDKEEEFL